MKRTRASKRATMKKRAMATAMWVVGEEEGDGDGGRCGATMSTMTKTITMTTMTMMTKTTTTETTAFNSEFEKNVWPYHSI